MIQQNYLCIKQDVHDMVNAEWQGMLNDPG